MSNPNLLVHKDLPDAALHRLKSRFPPLVLVQQFLRESVNPIDKWRDHWEALKPAQLAHSLDPTIPMPGMELPPTSKNAQ